jgi:hypothetical protein
MTRSTTHQSYGPGKFEGESCIARFAHDATMNGFGDYLISDDEDDNTQRVRGPFTINDVEQFEKDTQDEMCQPCVDELLKLDHVDTWENEQGFVYATA